MPAHRKDYDRAVTLYVGGMSIKDVAAEFGVTRQAMHKILKRREVAFRPQSRYGEENVFYRGGVVRNVAFSISSYVDNGTLVVQPCEVCGLEPLIVNGRQRIHGHHDDYNKLLEVRWLCKQHHDEWHAMSTPTPRSAEWAPTPQIEIARMGGKAQRKSKNKNGQIK